MCPATKHPPFFLAKIITASYQLFLVRLASHHNCWVIHVCPSVIVNCLCLLPICQPGSVSLHFPHTRKKTDFLIIPQEFKYFGGTGRICMPLLINAKCYAYFTIWHWLQSSNHHHSISHNCRDCYGSRWDVRKLLLYAVLLVNVVTIGWNWLGCRYLYWFLMTFIIYKCWLTL